MASYAYLLLANLYFLPLLKHDAEI